MNILIVTDLYPIFEGEEGIPLTIREFARGFNALGHNVQVFRPNFMLNTKIRGRKLFKSGKYLDNGTLKDTSAEDAPEDKSIKIFNKNFFLPFNRGSVIRAYKKFFTKPPVVEPGFDAIVAHMPSGILCADIISKEFNIPLLCAVHSSDIKVMTDLRYAPFFKQKMISAYRHASCVLPRSFWLKDKIKKVIPDIKKPVEIIYSGIPADITAQNEALERKFNPKKAKILTVSSLIKRKNIKNLILAYKKLKKKNPGVSLEIVGDGKLRPKLQELILKYNLDVKLLGALPKGEVLEKMKEADIFILPSKEETFGMVYMEALSCGLVVCCTKNSGIDGIIKDGKNGYTLKPSVRGIFDTLKKVLELNNKQYLEISKNALTTSKMFSYENSVKNYLEKIELYGSGV